MKIAENTRTGVTGGMPYQTGQGKEMRQAARRTLTSLRLLLWMRCRLLHFSSSTRPIWTRSVFRPFRSVFGQQDAPHVVRQSSCKVSDHVVNLASRQLPQGVGDTTCTGKYISKPPILGPRTDMTKDVQGWNKEDLLNSPSLQGRRATAERKITGIKDAVAVLPAPV